MPRLVSVSLDTNVLLDYAAGSEIVIDCIATIRKRIDNCTFVVLPTVILELVVLSENGSDNEIKLAGIALSNLESRWGFTPVNCLPVGHGIVQQIGRKIRAAKLLPEEEVNDSEVIAEAALFGATMLISSDSHIKDIDYVALQIDLRKNSDVTGPLIASPWKIVHEFFR